MSLKAIVDDVSALPEAFRSCYTKIEDADAGDLAGKFRLNVEGAHGFSLDAVDGLKTALSAEREAKRQLESRYKDFDGIDAKKARDALARIAKIGDLDPEKEADRIAGEKVDAIKTQLLGEIDADKKKWEVRETVLTGALKRLLVDNEALAALAKHKGNAALLQRVVTDRLRMTEKDDRFGVEVVDANGNPRIKDARGTPMTVEDLVLELRADKTYAVAFGSNMVPGGGTPPATNGDNPAAISGRYTRADWNAKLSSADEAERKKLATAYMAGQVEIVG